MSVFGGAVSAQVESTGFEAEDGWDAGYSICGPEFAATCSYPITNVCIPDDHAANQNCCEDDPNESTGWYMGDNSQHCNEPHIDNVHPFSGLQHLRFQPDGQGGSPSGCAGNLITDNQCNITALTPRLGPQANDRTDISFEIAGSDGSLRHIVFQAVAHDDPSGSTAATVLFTSQFLGVVSACDYFFARTSVAEGGVYRKFSLELDPGADTVRYCYGGNTVLLTKFGPGQARTVQGVTFPAVNGSGVWDIDDFSVTRGTSEIVACREFPSECQTPCGPRPCVTLKAVAINGEEIVPTLSVFVRPGDMITTEMFFSGWGGNIPEARGFEVKLGLRDGATSGAHGTVLPLGWDAPLGAINCTSAADCPPAYPMCNAGSCRGPNHDPESGAFITTSRSDYLLFGFPGFSGEAVDNLNYKYFGILEDQTGSADSGVPSYAGTLLLVASEDSCGTFTFGFPQDEDTAYQLFPIIFDSSRPPLTLGLTPRPLIVHVCAENGDSCSGVESCDGACCDPWNGDCQNAVAQAKCACPGCVWTGGADCVDIECKAEFVAIPTVSQWGLVVLTLLLLTGGKVMFGRRLTNPSLLPTI
jgi:hypothetical protein